MVSNDELQQQLAALRVAYSEQLPAKLQALQQHWQNLQHSPHAKTTLGDIKLQAHSLAGTAGTFGLIEISQQARSLEDVVLQLEQQWPHPAAELLQRGEQLLQGLLNEPLSAAQKENGNAITTVLPKHGGLIVIADDDFYVTEHLRLQLEHFGYQTSVFNTLEELGNELPRLEPLALILDLGFPGDPLAGAHFIQTVSLQRGKKKIPLVFLSERGDQEARLNAVRAGAVAYLVKPVDLTELVEVLDQVTEPQEEDPFKVLVVEDSVALARFYEITLKSVGMEVLVVNNPLHTLESIRDFAPELILMDLHLPNWNGRELAGMLRQQSAFVSLPIVFLSMERNAEVRLEAMEAGAEDFLQKPVDPRHLIAAVRLRARRYRELRRHIVQDSLTGLYNHTKAKEMLDIELTRARRQRTAMVFVMLDLDRFKEVNDNHGHPAGDRVLKTLAKLLRQRLRRTDVIGRYGGEEFMLVLPGTTQEQALALIEDLRLTFSRIPQAAYGCEFNATFSAGIAAFPQFDTATSITHAADLALYQAKREGRNRVVCQSS